MSITVGVAGGRAGFSPAEGVAGGLDGAVRGPDDAARGSSGFRAGSAALTGVAGGGSSLAVCVGAKTDAGIAATSGA